MPRRCGTASTSGTAIKKFSDAEFIGFENYARALWGGNDPATQQAFKTAYSQPFWDALGHNFLIIVLSMAIQLPLALLIALVLNRQFPRPQLCARHHLRALRH